MSSNSQYDAPETAFRSWLDDLVQEIADNAVPKARKYGTGELAALGATLSSVSNSDAPPPTDRRALQIALWMYAAGKLARWTAAVRRDEQPDRDTVYDLLVYSLMWLKVEETGEWWPDNIPPAPVQDSRDDNWQALVDHVRNWGTLASPDIADPTHVSSLKDLDRVRHGGVVRANANSLDVFVVARPGHTDSVVWFQTGDDDSYSTEDVWEFLSQHANANAHGVVAEIVSFGSNEQE